MTVIVCLPSSSRNKFLGSCLLGSEKQVLGETRSRDETVCRFVAVCTSAAQSGQHLCTISQLFCSRPVQVDGGADALMEGRHSSQSWVAASGEYA